MTYTLLNVNAKPNEETNMNLLKSSYTIHCETCGCSLKRTKTFRVEAVTREEAIQEASAKIDKWRGSLKGQNCKVCDSIIRDLANSGASSR